MNAVGIVPLTMLGWHVGCLCAEINAIAELDLDTVIVDKNCISVIDVLLCIS